MFSMAQGLILFALCGQTPTDFSQSLGYMRGACVGQGGVWPYDLITICNVPFHNLCPVKPLRSVTSNPQHPMLDRPFTLHKDAVYCGSHASHALYCIESWVGNDFPMPQKFLWFQTSFLFHNFWNLLKFSWKNKWVPRIANSLVVRILAWVGRLTFKSLLQVSFLLLGLVFHVRFCL